jgi:hypothetical protein
MQERNIHGAKIQKVRKHSANVVNEFKHVDCSKGLGPGVGVSGSLGVWWMIRLWRTAHFMGDQGHWYRLRGVLKHRFNKQSIKHLLLRG